MAVGISDIPNLTPTRINAAPMSGGAAAAPAVALGELAEGLSSISRPFAHIARGIQNHENARAESETRLGWSSGLAGLEQELAQDPDPANHLTRAENFLQKAKSTLDEPSLAPVVRERLALQFDEFASRTKTHVGAGAAKLATKRATLAFSNELETATRLGDGALLERAMDTANSAGFLLLPEEKEKVRRQFREKVSYTRLAAQIEMDPAGFLAQNPADKVPDQMEPGDYARLRNHARSQERQATAESIGFIQDAIVSGSISTPEGIRQFAPHLRPTTLAAMDDYLEGNISERLKAHRATPEYRAGVIGSLKSQLENYQVSSDDYDEPLANMQLLAHSLPAGPEREQLEARITAVVKSQQQEIKTYAEAAQKTLDTHFSAAKAKLGPVKGEEIMPTQTAINDHFLENSENLKKLGYSDDQIGMIQAGETQRNKVDLFKSLWTQRSGKATASEFVLQTARAIRDGESTVRKYVAPESRDMITAQTIALDRKHGLATMKLAEFLKLEPKASTQQIDAKISEIRGEQSHGDVTSGILDRKPRVVLPAGDFMPGETALNLPKTLVPLRDAFVEEGLKNGIDPRLLAAIAMHETASGTSSAFKTKNNAMGVSNASGPLTFSNTRESIARMAQLLGSRVSGPYRSVRSIADLGAVYAPAGAENDPKSLNSGWSAGVSKHFKDLGGNPLTRIK